MTKALTRASEKPLEKARVDKPGQGVDPKGPLGDGRIQGVRGGRIPVDAHRKSQVNITGS